MKNIFRMGIGFIVTHDDRYRRILPIRLETTQNAPGFPEGMPVPKWVPAPSGVRDYGLGVPDVAFAKLAQARSKDFKVSEICVHGGWVNTFVAAPTGFDFDGYREQLKCFALGLADHRTDPGIVEYTKALVEKRSRSFFNMWLDIDRGAMFTFEPSMSGWIVTGPAARLGEYPQLH